LRALLACGEVEKVVVMVRADVLAEAKGWVEKECGLEGSRVEVMLRCPLRIATWRRTTTP
jgi:hypothetical protein